MDDLKKKRIWEILKEKIFSRKLLVWIVATVLLVLKIISEEIWLALGMTYIGVNASLAAIEVIKMRRGPQDALPAEGKIAATPSEQIAEKDAAALRG